MAVKRAATKPVPVEEVAPLVADDFEETDESEETEEVDPEIGAVIVGEDGKFNWDVLSEDLPQEYTRGVPISTRDLEKETPEAIKSRVMASYASYVQTFEKLVPDEGKASVADVKKAQAAAAKASTRITPAGSEDAGNAFLKLAKAYAKFKGMTLRGAVNPQNKAQVVWRAKPAETRSRES